MKHRIITTHIATHIVLLLLICGSRRVCAQLADEHPVLIISSYNPDSYSTSTNISQFIEEYNRVGGRSRVHIENMNCRSFSESLRWKERMHGILAKYRGSNRPGIIILLGQEAWASYLSQHATATANIPVFTAMASRNAIILPDANIASTREWMPESVDFIDDAGVQHIQGGFLYEYDVERNIRLIKQLYPATQNIAFVSDNTYGGVSIQAFVKKEMRNFPELNLILLDGRVHTIYTIVEALRTLPPSTALLLGTWRVDENDGYFMQNATYSMMEAAPNIPVFSLTSLGLGYWAIGGYMPDYRGFGTELARQVVAVQQSDSLARRPVLVNNLLKIDDRKIAQLGIVQKAFPEGTVYINVEPTFYEEYRSQIWGVILIVTVLILGLVLLLILFSRTRRMKNELLVSESQLREAKERAEQSNRMKSAFLANMSHEIRTPLNAIVGFSNILASMNPSPEKRKICSDNIQNSSNLLLRLINDILDLSKLEAEKMQFAWANCDIVQLLRRTVSTMEQATANGNRYVFRPRREQLILCTDEQRLQQVLINLLSNASKFTKNGTITLDFTADPAKDHITFSVTDTGRGISPEKRDAVFERFEKLDNFAQGTGLGLSICRQITRKWGGMIWVDPNYNDGARFVFTHPVNPPIATAPEA